MSLLRWVDLPCFYPVFTEANGQVEAEKKLDSFISDLVVYNAPLRGPFSNKDEAVTEAKREYNEKMNEAKQQTVLV